MADDWSFQASYKFGQHSNSMLNVRADSPDDLIGKVKYLTAQLKEGNTFGDLQDALDGATVPQAVSHLQAAVPGTQVITAAPPAPLWSNQAGGGLAPTCNHGPMKDFQGKFTKAGAPYRNRYYCGSPFGTPREQQCPPQG